MTNSPPPMTGQKPRDETSVLCVRLNTALGLLGVGKTKMYELIGSGEIEAIKIGRSTLVLRDSLTAYVARAERLRSGRP